MAVIVTAWPVTDDATLVVSDVVVGTVPVAVVTAFGSAPAEGEPAVGERRAR